MKENNFNYLNDFTYEELENHIDYLLMIICRQMFNSEEYYKKATLELNKSLELLKRKKELK